MTEHPIQGLMRTALESLKAMVDVNTVVGDPIETTDGQVIVPISRVSLGFVAGGTEFTGRGMASGGRERDAYGGDGGEGWSDGGSQFPFGGGSGAGVSVQPVGFLIVTRDNIRMLPVEGGRATVDKLMELAPRVLERLTGRGQDGRAEAGDQADGRRRGGQEEGGDGRTGARIRFGGEEGRQGQDGEQGDGGRQAAAGRLVRRLVRDLTERGGQDGGHGQ